MQEQDARMRHYKGIDKFRRRLESQRIRPRRLDLERAGRDGAGVHWEVWVIAAIVVAAFANAAVILF